jgi:hypothetical protein
MLTVNRRADLGVKLVLLSGLGVVAYGAAFLVRNFTGFIELGLTPELIGGTPEQIAAFSPKLHGYISHLHVAVAGFLIALGLGIVALAWFGIRAGQRWAMWTALLMPAVAFGIALPLHYMHNLATLGHLGPLYLATAVLVAGIALSHKALKV